MRSIPAPEEGVPASTSAGDTDLLRHLNRLLIRATDLSGVVDAALDMVIALGASNAAVFIYDPDREELVLAGERNHPASLIAEWQRVRLSEETMVTRAVRSGELQSVSDLLAEANELPKAADSAQQTGFRSAVAVPLIVGDRPVGSLACGLSRPRVPDDPREAALRAIAQTVAIAIVHARLTEESRRREADQAMLATAARVFNSTLDLATILQDASRIAAEAIGDSCMILLIEPHNPYLRPAASYYRDPVLREARLRYVQAHPPRADEGALREIIRSGQPKLVSEPPAHPNVAQDYVAELQIVSWVGAPIIYQGETLGILLAASTTLGVRFGQRELRLAASLADTAAPAIANARLFRQLRSEHGFLESVIDNLPEAVLIVEGSDLQLVAINRTGRQLLGSIPEIGGSMRDWLTHTDWRDNEASACSPEEHPLTRAARGETILAQELVLRRPDGDEVAILGNFAPVREQGQQVVAAVAVMQDVTWRRELDQEKDDFVAVAAHELRSPLTVIRGQLQLTGRAAAEIPDPIRARLEVVRDQVERMSDLARRLLDVSRIGTGSFDLDLRTTDLVALAREVSHRFQPRTDAHAIVAQAPPGPVVGWWDRSRLDEVLANLLDNAIRYSPGGGQITVAVEDEGSVALLRVSDQGIGIASDAIPHVFQRYSRAVQPAQGLGSGIGLGLYICRAIVEAHGGTIHVDSVPGTGTTFSIRLPKVPAARRSPGG